MTTEDRDPRVSERYRALGDESPPPAIDAAVRAAARRAVGARPQGERFTRRWAVPVSVAAMVVLSVGVVLRVQHEQPALEAPGATVPPAARDTARAPTAASARDAAAVAANEATRPAAIESQRSTAGADSRHSAADVMGASAGPTPRRDVPAPPRQKSATPSVAPMLAEPPVARPEAPPASSPVEIATTAPAASGPGGAPGFVADVPRSAAGTPAGDLPPPAGPVAPQEAVTARQERRSIAAESARARSAVVAPQREAEAARAGAPRAQGARRDAAAAEDADPVEARERMLDEILRLRRAGRHADADRQLDAFRKRYPDYEIPRQIRSEVLGPR